MAKIHQKHSRLKVSIFLAAVRAVLAVLAACAVVWGWYHLYTVSPAWVSKLEIGPVEGIWTMAIVAVLAIFVLMLRLRDHCRAIAIRRAGANGEKLALRQLKALPAGYHVFSNLRLSYEGRESEMDLVVVGPGGVGVVEVKNYTGEVTGNAAAHDLSHLKNDRVQTFYNPIRQVSTHVFRLWGYLKEHGCQARVRGFVYFVNPSISVRISGTADVPWFTANHLREMMTELTSARDELTARQVNEIVRILKKA